MWWAKEAACLQHSTLLIPRTASLLTNLLLPRMSITRFPGRDARNQKMHSDNIASLYIAVFQQAEYLRKRTLQFIRFGRTRLYYCSFIAEQNTNTIWYLSQTFNGLVYCEEKKKNNLFSTNNNSRSTNKQTVGSRSRSWLTDRQAGWFLRPDCATSSEYPQALIAARRRAAAPPVQSEYPAERRAAAAVPLPEST